MNGKAQATCLRFFYTLHYFCIGNLKPKNENRRIHIIDKRAPGYICDTELGGI